jgi:hypothetical protein
MEISLKFNSSLYNLNILQNYGFLKVKPRQEILTDDCSWSDVTEYEDLEYLSDMVEVYALKIDGGRRGQTYFIHTYQEVDGSIIFVVNSSTPDGSGSFGILPSVLFKMFEDKVVVF